MIPQQKNKNKKKNSEYWLKKMLREALKHYWGWKHFYCMYLSSTMRLASDMRFSTAIRSVIESTESPFMRELIINCCCCCRCYCCRESRGSSRDKTGVRGCIACIRKVSVLNVCCSSSTFRSPPFCRTGIRFLTAKPEKRQGRTRKIFIFF